MEWSELLSPLRLGCEMSGLDWSDEVFRSEYQRDFDRIAFSREFRRLQGKTQVFPDPTDEKVHNRLTHSIEASCVGRYLGAKAASARGRRLMKRLSSDQRRDFTEFDGNQMTFRLLAHSLPEKTSAEGGKRLTIFEPEERVGFLRAKATNALIAQAAEVFGANGSALLNGTFEDDLLSLVRSATELEVLRKACREKVYSHRTVVDIEAAGFSVLPALLDTYMNSVVAGPHDEKSKKIVQTLPKHTAEAPADATEYERLLRVLVYVVGMTDRYAISSYRTLLGTHLPTST